MSSTIMIIGCGFPQLGLLRFCRAQGLTVVGVDWNASAVGVPHCTRFAQVSTRDIPAVIDAAREHNIDGVMTAGSEAALHTAVRVAEALGLPFYADSETVERCQSKALMRRAYRDGGAPTPYFRVVEAGDALDGVEFPAIVKPAHGWGQRGVCKVHDEAELRAAVPIAIEMAGQLSDTPPSAIIEGFILGREFSVNAYTLNGETRVLSVTERIITSYPDPPGITFAEVYPSGLDDDAERAVVDAARAGVNALGITRGPTYTQMRYSEQGAFIVETAHRLGGGLDPDIAELVSGVSMYRLIVGVALGRSDWERLEVTGPKHDGAIGKFLIAEPGRVEAIEGVDVARGMPGVIDAQSYVPVGGEVHPLTTGANRAGHVLAVGADRAEAEARAAAAAEQIHFITG